VAFAENELDSVQENQMVRTGVMKNSKGKTMPLHNAAGEQDRRLRLARIALPAVVFLWPLVYLFRLVVPINGEYTAIGNDFISLYYRYKIYLLANLAEFRFPLWSPSEAAGFPFYTNPFAQVFYPLNLLLVAWYKILGGYSSLDHQLFTVLGISIFALGLFMWLKTINKNVTAVLFATLIMSVSFKVTEIIRFPNAVHTAAWYPWVLYAMTKIIQSQSLKKAIWHGFLLAFSIICICTGGYPYFSYYSIFLFTPYLLVILIRPLRIRFIDAGPVNWKRSLPTLVLAGVAAVVICSPYILAVKSLMPLVTDRNGTDFAFSTEHVFNLKDTAGSLVYPPDASTEGWYFFSITALLIILMYLFSRNRKIQNSGQNKNDLNCASAGGAAIKLFLFAWIATITYISYGRSSYLFMFLWKFLPGFSSLRIWGRINIIMVPIIAWLLSLAYAHFESLIADKIAGAEKQSKIRPAILTLAAVYAVILAVQLYFYVNDIYGVYWVEYFKHLTPLRINFIIRGLMSFTIIVVLVIFSKRARASRRYYPKLAMVILLATAVLEMRYMAVQIWTHQQQWEPGRIKLDIAQMNETSFRYKRIDRNFTIALNPIFSVGVIENWYFNSYVKFLKNTENELEARRVLLGVADGTRIFFSESIQHSTVTSFLRDASRYATASGRLLSYDGDELDWQIEAPTAGYLSFIDNWAPGWKAWVDGQPTDIELLFGTFKCVRLTPGRHRVRFCYLPEVFQW
jgi:hypothetical protein